MISITTKSSIVVSDERPDKWCATGYGEGQKCPWFIPRVKESLLFGAREAPFCDKYMRDLVPDDVHLLRDRCCVRDFGAPGAPGRFEHVEPERPHLVELRRPEQRAHTRWDGDPMQHPALDNPVRVRR